MSALKNFFKIATRPMAELCAATVVASISAQYALTWAKAIREPSMHADLFIVLMRDTGPRNC